MFRSWPSDPLATAHPWFSSPTRFSAGTRTSLKNTSLKSMSSRLGAEANGRQVTPGRAVGISKTLIPLCLGASGSVRTNVRITSESCAPDVHTFWPLTTKWSPSESVAATARVLSDARSDPAPGSLMPSAAVISARRIGTAHRCCCWAVPNVMREAAMMPTPWALNVGTIRRRDSSIWWTYCSRIDALRPPNSGE
jgi:hypothetical protein